MTSDTTKQKRPYVKSTQAMSAIDFNGLLRPEVVVGLTGLSRSTINRKLELGEFPQPVKFGKRCNRWRAADVRAWIDGLTT